VRTPDDRCADVPQAGDHAGGLRIVQKHDVVGADARRQQLCVGGAATLVDGALGIAQRTAVARVAVQAVVQALGQREELRVARHHHPACVETGATHVTDQRAQHLGDAAASSRVDVPERPLIQQLAAARDRALEPCQALGRKHLAEPIGIRNRSGSSSVTGTSSKGMPRV
jgi:hypothetical protein